MDAYKRSCDVHVGDTVTLVGGQVGEVVRLFPERQAIAIKTRDRLYTLIPESLVVAVVRFTS